MELKSIKEALGFIFEHKRSSRNIDSRFRLKLRNSKIYIQYFNDSNEESWEEQWEEQWQYSEEALLSIINSTYHSVELVSGYEKYTSVERKIRKIYDKQKNKFPFLAQ